MHPPIINAVRFARTQHTVAVRVPDLANAHITVAANAIIRYGIMKNPQIAWLDGPGEPGGKLLAARETFVANRTHSTRSVTKATTTSRLAIITRRMSIASPRLSLLSAMRPPNDR